MTLLVLMLLSVSHCSVAGGVLGQQSAGGQGGSGMAGSGMAGSGNVNDASAE